VYDITVTYIPQRMALVAWRAANAENIGEVITKAFNEVLAHIESGAAFGSEERIVVYPRDWGRPGDHEIGVAVVIADGGPGPGIRLEEMPACQAVKTVHYGPYTTIREGWGVIWDWMDEHDLEPADGCWELYLNSPDEVPEPELATELLVPLP
jgi:effector-binding domain-containing protein